LGGENGQSGEDRFARVLLVEEKGGAEIVSFMAGDIVFTRGTAWYSKLIRWGTRHTGETRSRTNHTGVGLDPNYFIEALHHVVATKWSDFAKNNALGTFEIWRNEALTEVQREAVAAKARGYLGRDYGYSKILLQSLDCILGKVLCMDVMAFRRLAFMDKYPICSWVVAYSYFNGIGYSFGISPRVADPDEIHDFVANHEDWKRVE